jgi:SNF2 family DNA or RNA helicase
MTSTKALWNHQKRGILFAREKAKQGVGIGLFFEQGTGKTRTTLEILQDRYREGGAIKPTLILCPPVVVPNWKSEFKLYTDIPERKVITLTGPQIDRVAKFETLLHFDPNFIAITNYEALLMDRLFNLLNHWMPEIIVADESHKIKTHNAKRTKQLIKLSERARFSYVLSGTPVLNTPMDLFSQYLVMDRGKTFGQNFFGFRNRYFIDKNANMPKHVRFPKWELQVGAIERINRSVTETSIRVRKSECLDLPPVVKQRIEVKMLPQQQKAYEEMKNDFITFYQSNACVAQLALTKLLRLQQIVSGYISFEDGGVTHFKDSERESALKELLEELTPNHKVIVWAVFQENYKVIERVCKDLGVKYVGVYGGISETQRQEAIKDFNQDQATRVYIGNPLSGGIGVNLTVSDISIYYSRDFSLESALQSAARNHRGGSEIHQKITHIDLITPETIDEIIVEKLHEKESNGELLISQDFASDIIKNVLGN